MLLLTFPSFAAAPSGAAAAAAELFLLRLRFALPAASPPAVAAAVVSSPLSSSLSAEALRFFATAGAAGAAVFFSTFCGRSSSESEGTTISMMADEGCASMWR